MSTELKNTNKQTCLEINKLQVSEDTKKTLTEFKLQASVLNV